MRSLKRPRPTLATLAVLFFASLAPLAAADGDLLSSGTAVFDLGGPKRDVARAVAVQPDGRIVLFGDATTGTDSVTACLARFLPGGSLDFDFGNEGRVVNPLGLVLDTVGAAVHALPDGKLLVAGTLDISGGDTDVFVARLLANGSLDPTFNNGSGWIQVWFDLGGSLADAATALAVDAAGRIVVAGHAATAAHGFDFALLRLTAAGELDPAFSGDGRLAVDLGGAVSDRAYALALDPFGRIVAAGASEHGASGDDLALLRVTAAGEIDGTFGSGGAFILWQSGGGTDDDVARALAVQPDGGILVAGETATGTGHWNWQLARLLPDGEGLDTAFLGGLFDGNFLCGDCPIWDDRDAAHGLALQGDGRVVFAGSGYLTSSGTVDFGVARRTTWGWPDPAFAPATGYGTRTFDLHYGVGGFADGSLAMALAHDGRIVVAGWAEWNGADTDFAWARFDSSYLFADGFEWGDTSRWSATVP